MIVDVFRGESLDEGKMQIYEVPVPQKENWTVMDVLDYIALNLDSSLSYYKHSVCNHGICGRCSVEVNGKIRLACLCVANDYERLVLKPVRTRRLVKDLVTKIE